jgi:hypothetical protein
MRFAVLAWAVLLLGGCSAVVEDPKTGERLSCSEGWRDASPWSQSDACVANHIAQGWVIVDDSRQ